MALILYQCIFFMFVDGISLQLSSTFNFVACPQHFGKLPLRIGFCIWELETNDSNFEFWPLLVLFAVLFFKFLVKK